MQYAIDFLIGKLRRINAEIALAERTANQSAKEVCIRQKESIEKAIEILSK